MRDAHALDTFGRGKPCDGIQNSLSEVHARDHHHRLMADFRRREMSWEEEMGAEILKSARPLRNSPRQEASSDSPPREPRFNEAQHLLHPDTYVHLKSERSGGR